MRRLVALLLLCAPAFAQPVYHTADQTVTPSTSSTSGYTLTGDAPANLAEGDLITLCVTAADSRGDSASVFGLPSGFNLIRSEQNSASEFVPEIAAAWKIATDSEPADYSVSVTIPSGGRSILKLGRVTGHDPMSPIDVSNGTNSSTTSVTSIDAPSVTVTEDDSLLLTCTGGPRNVTSQVGNYGVSPMTLVAEANNTGTGSDANIAAAIQTVNSGATGTRTTSWTDSGRAAVVIFAISPAAVSNARRRLMMIRGH